MQGYHNGRKTSFNKVVDYVSEVKPRPNVTWLEIETLRNVHGSERIFFRDCTVPPQVVEFCEKHFPEVNYLRVETSVKKWFLKGMNNNLCSFVIDGDVPS